MTKKDFDARVDTLCAKIEEVFEQVEALWDPIAEELRNMISEVADMNDNSFAFTHLYAADSKLAKFIKSDCIQPILDDLDEAVKDFNGD